LDHAHIIPNTIYANTTLRLGSFSLWNSLPTRDHSSFSR